MSGTIAKRGVVGSRDLRHWRAIPAPGVSKTLTARAQKSSSATDTTGCSRDPNRGLDVYRSENLEDWTYQGKILDKPGWRNDDASVGKHCDVVVCGDRAYIFYLVEPACATCRRAKVCSRLVGRRSAIQAAELGVQDGKLTCDRNKLFRIRLTPPDSENKTTPDADYRAIPATGFWSGAGAVPKGFDPAFAQAFLRLDRLEVGLGRRDSVPSAGRGQVPCGDRVFRPKYASGQTCARGSDRRPEGRCPRYGRPAPVSCVSTKRPISTATDSLQVSCSHVEG